MRVLYHDYVPVRVLTIAAHHSAGGRLSTYALPLQPRGLAVLDGAEFDVREVWGMILDQ